MKTDSSNIDLNSELGLVEYTFYTKLIKEIIIFFIIILCDINESSLLEALMIFLTLTYEVNNSSGHKNILALMFVFS